MFRLTAIAVSFIFIFFSSGYSTIVINSNDIKNQLYYFKVWGFLKYHHPTLASGKMDADSLFLSNLRFVETAKNKKALENVIIKMIDDLKPIENSKLAAASSSATKLLDNRDQSWFTSNHFFSVKLRKRLRYIYLHRFTDTNHFYYTVKNFGSELPHEKPYDFGDAKEIPYAYRMLAIAKIQAAVDYLFPHKYLMDKSWDKVIVNSIPKFAQSESRLAYEKELLLLTANLNDTHTLRFYKFLKNWKQILQVKYYPPFDYKLVDSGRHILVTKVIIPGLCQAAGIQEGDLITHMKDLDVIERVGQLGNYLSASNTNALNQRLSRFFDNLLFITDSLHSSLTYKRNGETTTTKIEWANKKEHFSTLTTYVNQLLGPEIEGADLEYVTPDVVNFRAGETKRFLESLPKEKLESGMDSLFGEAGKKKGIIFDMRKYPDWGGFFYLLYNKFGKDRVPFAQYFALDKQNMGVFKLLTDNLEYYPNTAKPGNTEYDGRVIILVNGETLSAGEYYTMFLQHIFPNSITLGEQSAGADGDEKVLMLPGGYQLPFTGNAIFYPDGTEAQRKGVKVNMVLNPKVEDLVRRRDTMLLEATKIIEN
jgi:C-terminal processing protease CtpA/Prc